MSVLLPWDRKRPSRDKTPSGVRPPGVARSAPPGQQPAARGSATRASPSRKILALGAVACLAVSTIALVLRMIPAEFETLWESPGSRLVSAYDGRYLVSDGAGLSVWDQSGSLLDLGTEPAEAVLSRDGLFFIDSASVMRLYLPGGADSLSAAAVTTVGAASAGERLLECLDGGSLLSAKPREGVKFGESWVLRAAMDSGTLWEETLPGLPLLLKREGSRIGAGIVDLSSGGSPMLAILDSKTGKTAWTKCFQAGVWRGLGFLADGTAVAVLDTGLFALKPDGSLAWSLDLPGPIIAAEVTAGAVFLATAATGGLAWLFSPYRVEAVSSSGTILWTHPLRERPESLVGWTSPPTETGVPDTLVALSRSHVIGFSMGDGERLFAKRTGSRPVSLRGSCLLLEGGQGLRLVKFLPAGLSGKALSP